MKKHWHASHKENLSIGQKAADAMRNGMGSWPFVFIFLIAMVVWAFYNGTKGFDPYPFILLNLLLSTLAGLQGAILLIAAKRADEVSAALAQHDYDTNLAAKAEIEELQKTIARLENEKHNEILKGLQQLVSKLDRLTKIIRTQEKP